MLIELQTYISKHLSLYSDTVLKITSSEINLHSRFHSGRNLLSGLKRVASHLGSCVGDALCKLHRQKATVN